MNKILKKTFSTSLKISISLVLLWLVYSKISFVLVLETIKETKAIFFIIALVFYALSQLLSAKRLLLCFYQMDFYISPKSNRLLYLVGMFYNFFVPGGIGGDAYKVYLLNKQFRWSIKKLSAVVLADRASGLIAICCWIVLLSMSIKELHTVYSLLWLPLLLIIGVIIGKVLFSKIFPSFTPKYTYLLLYSFIIQGLQLGAVYFILLSLHQHEQFMAYFILFFVSSLLSIFSFSGIGIREFIFLKFSPFFNFEPQISVSVGVIFTIVSLIVSLPGIYPILFTKKKMYLNSNVIV
ncbi:hypothetical protein C7377_1551 [Balneicella halophila]|uniref:Lysylphosphatidylglycerol synthase-like protein n=1 Tax=Balneicella halophila TaxID=1537566 RepID=A0A7L4UPC2_BALHA|nr:lysylphosphatidylglycerol synthase transmembrane domain-containing protein [Balneicella halophila]PVX49913.1 hypothetical protein C7377_1551 [Balneicella halophila]